MNTTPIPGAVNGTTIRRSTVGSDAPSTRAASSNPTGTASMEFLHIQMAIGSDDAARNSEVATRESSTPARTPASRPAPRSP